MQSSDNPTQVQKEMTYFSILSWDSETRPHMSCCTLHTVDCTPNWCRRLDWRDK